MCAECETTAVDHIVDYVAIVGVPLEVAIRLERDAVVQHVLNDRAGDDVVQMAIDVSAIIEDAGERLKMIRDFFPKTWAALIEMAQKERVP